MRFRRKRRVRTTRRTFKKGRKSYSRRRSVRPQRIGFRM